MLELIYETNSTKCYRGKKFGKNIYIKVFNFYNYSEEQIEEALKTSELESYLKDKYDLQDMLSERLNNLFSIRIIDNKYEKRNILTPLNYSLYDYEKIIIDTKEVDESLKCAFISIDTNSDTYYIAMESYDENSNTGDRRVEEKCYKAIGRLNKHISNFIGKEYSHIECY